LSRVEAIGQSGGSVLAKLAIALIFLRHLTHVRVECASNFDREANSTCHIPVLFRAADFPKAPSQFLRRQAGAGDSGRCVVPLHRG
jgi:hypothetical protein